MWNEVVKKIRENASDGRNLTYQDGAIGITALLSCPIKWELSQKHGLKPEAVEIDDGYVWEKQVKSAFKELYPHAQEEKDLLYQANGHTLHGHLDLFVEFEDEVWGVELKSPRLLLLRGIPKVDNGFHYDDGLVIHNPQYYKQAQIQRFLLQKLYPDKKVRQFLFYKALCKCGSWSSKLYVVSEVKTSVSEEELANLIKAFHEDKSPRYPNECENYCVFYKEGLCQGKEWKEQKTQLDPQVEELLKTYHSLQSDLKALESTLKKSLKGSVKFGGKEIGWVKRESVELDLEKLLEVLPKEKQLEALQVKWQKKKEVLQEYGDVVVKEVKQVIEWRI